MRFVVFGAGAIGSVLGARLADTGANVVLIGREAQVSAVNDQGLRLWRPTGSTVVRMAAETSLGAIESRPDDVVLLCVKGQHTESALDSIEQAFGTEVPLFCCQNGTRNEAVAQRRFSNVNAVVTHVPAQYRKPGAAINSATGSGGSLGVGRYPQGADATSQAVSQALRSAGFTSSAFENVMPLKWHKYMRSLVNAVSAITDGQGDVAAVDALLRTEAAAVTHAASIQVASDEAYARDMRLDTFTSVPPPLERFGSSSWQSLERGAGSIEARSLNGYIAELGREHGVAAPANALIAEIAEDMAQRGMRPGAMTAEQLLERLTSNDGPPGKPETT